MTSQRSQDRDTSLQLANWYAVQMAWPLCFVKIILLLCRDYKVAFDQRQDPWMASRLYKPFAPIAAISFPFFWAESFGEFGSDAWYLWGFQFRETGVQTRSCMWHSLNLTRGLD